MDLNDPRRRLQVLNQSNPSLRASVAPQPQLQVQQAPQMQLHINTGDQNINTTTPDQAMTITRDGGTAGAPAPVAPRSVTDLGLGFLKSAGHTLAEPAEPFAAGVARLLPGGQNDIAANNDAVTSTQKNQQIYHNLFQQGKISKAQYATYLQSLSGDYSGESNEAQRIADTADRSKAIGSAIQVASTPFLGAAEAGNTLLAKAGLGALEGGGLGLANEFSNNADPTLKGAAVNTGLGAAAGGVLPFIGAGLSKVKNAVFPKANAESVGLTEDTLKFVQKSKDPEQIHALLESLYGGTSDQLQAISESIAKSSNKKFIIKELESLPEQAGAAGGLGAIVSDAVAREKYGVSPLTGEVAPPAVPAPEVPDIRPLGPQAPNDGNGIQLNANKVTDEAYRAAEEDALKQAGVTTTKADTPTSSTSDLSTAIKANAGDVAQNPVLSKGIQDAYLKTGIQDPYNLLITAIADNPNKSEIRSIVEQLVGNNDDANLKNRLTTKLTKAKTAGEVHDIIDAETAAANPVAQPAVEAAAAPAPEPAASAPEMAIASEAPATPAAEVHPDDAKALKAAGVTDEAAKTNVAADKAAAESAPHPLANASPEVRSAAQKLSDNAEEFKRAAKEQKASISSQKSQRVAMGQKAFDEAGGGEAGVNAAIDSLKGSYGSINYKAPEFTPQEAQALKDHVATLPAMFDRINTLQSVKKAIGEIDKVPTKTDLKRLEKAFGQDFAGAIQSRVDDVAESKTNYWKEVASLPKSLMASFDISGGRQAGALATRFPKEFASAFKDQLHFFKNDDFYKASMQEIADRPTAGLMERADLATTGTEQFGKDEEQFVSNIAEHMPGDNVASKAFNGTVGAGVRASDRAYTGLLTKFRADVFDNVIGKLEKGGVDVENMTDGELKSLGRYINTFSGRGDLGKMEKYAAALGDGFFSPRLWKSRLDMLNPVFYAKLEGPARKLALQNAATFTGTVTTLLGLATLIPGVSVGTDARSSDFGKIKLGNTRFDITGGLAQNLVLAEREISGEKKNSETGDVTKLGEKYGAADRASILGDTITNKENPLLATGTRIVKGKDRGGNPVNPTTEVAKLGIPLIFQGAYSGIKDTGSVGKGLLLAAPDAVGISSQTYGTIASKDKGPDGKVLPGHEKALPEYKGKIEENMIVDPSTGKVLQDPKNGKPLTVKFPDGATKIEKKAILDKALTSKLSASYKDSLSGEDKALMGLSDEKLKQYVKDGTIDQARFDKIKNYQKTADSASKSNQYSVPDGVNSDQAKTFYQKYNSMDKKDQEAWLKQPADDNAKAIASDLNKLKAPGIDDFKPSNALSKAYAEYEKDINNHPEYSAVDRENKAKSFQNFAFRLNYTPTQSDIYTEGSSKDLYALLAQKAISKEDLDKAIEIDNQLYHSGLSGSLQFSKKFRLSYGVAVPTGPGGASIADGEGSGGNKYHGGTLSIPSLASNSGGSSKPTFSARSRNVTFKAPVMPKSSSNTKKISIKL